jgi:DNA-binding CsgD family transcriptional regulator
MSVPVGGAPESLELVGRGERVLELERFAAAAADGAGRLVLVSGDAGIGKTSLVAAALARTQLFRVYASASQVATPPFGPIAAALRALRRDCPAAFDACASRAPWLAGLLPELGAATESSDRGALRDAIVGAICDIARVQPLALTLDDLQWADHATIDLLPELAHAARTAPLLIVAVYASDGVPRGHPIRALRDALRRARRLAEITVGPLDEADVRTLAERRTGATVDADAARRLHQATGGVPFFVEALADAMASRDRPVDRSRCDALAVPETLRDAVFARFDRLPPAARKAADAAAVIGTEFALDLLSTLGGGEQAVGDLLESGVVAERAPGMGGFRPALAREVVYAGIPWTRRRALHRAAAEALEASGLGIEQAAEHWRAAGEDERARRALISAAAESRRLHAHRDVVQRLRQAVDLWPPGSEETERLAALGQLGDAAQLAGLFADALRAWREVADSAAAAADHGAAARALRKIANVHELNCDWPRAVAARQDAAAAFATAGERAEAAVEGYTIGVRLRTSARYAAGLEVVAGALADAHAAGRTDLALRIAALEGNLRARSGQVAEGIAAVRAALDAALEHNRPDVAGEIYQRLADAIERSSDFPAANAVNYEGVALCERNKLPAQLTACLGCLSWALIRCGEWEQSAAVCRQMLEIAGDNPTARAGALCGIGLTHVLRGELRKGEPLLVEADALARRIEHALLELTSRWGLALHDALSGNDVAAAERCRSILARWRRMEERHVPLPILRWSATCFARLGDRDGVRACADALAEIVTTFGHAEPLSALAQALGEIAWLDGDLAQATEQFEHAIALLEGFKLPRERVESELRAAAACAALGRRDAAVAYAREASRGAERLGARPLAEAAANELRALGEALSGALGPRAGRRAEQAGLTARQLQILGEISKGLTDKQVARALRLSPRTVETHVANALAALDCRSRTEAVRKASELGLLAPAAR